MINEFECPFCHKIIHNKGALATHKLWCDPNNINWQNQYRIKHKKLLKEKNFKNITKKRNKKLSNTKLKKSNPNLIINYFENINTEEKSYWLGFLYGDGCISKKARSITLNLKISDENHLKKFKKCLKAKNLISKKYNYSMCKFAITSEKMVNDLIKLGCIPNKTTKLNNIPNISFNLIKHFIRGLFDADGCIYINNNNIFFILTGRENFIYNINKFLVKNKIINHYNQLSYYKKNRNVVDMRYEGIFAIRIFNWLYMNSTIYLERKYKKWKNFEKEYYKIINYNLLTSKTFQD